MTERARLVLDDCELALEFLEQATTDQIWRIHWFAAVTLVRTVGDVLHKVDGRDGRLQPHIQQAYADWRADRPKFPIFWEFIKDQRDKLVHEYDSDVHPSEHAGFLVELALHSLNDGAKSHAREVFELDENIYRPMLSGPWEGIDGRDVLREAIDWWHAVLDEIDRKSELPSNS